MTSTGDIAPVEMGAPQLVDPLKMAKRKIPTSSTDPKKKKDMRSRMASRLIGEDSRDGFVIPDDAKEVDSLEVTGDGLTDLKTPQLPGEKPKNPYSGEEPLILPAASLVAPDVTPEALYPLDPSQLPGADAGKSPEAAPVAPAAMPPPAMGAPAAAAASPALDLVLGKAPQMSTESAMARLPGIPAPGALPALETETAAPVGEAALGQGQPMPEHKHANVSDVMGAFSKFVPRGSMKPLQE